MPTTQTETPNTFLPISIDAVGNNSEPKSFWVPEGTNVDSMPNKQAAKQIKMDNFDELDGALIFEDRYEFDKDLPLPIEKSKQATRLDIGSEQRRIFLGDTLEEVSVFSLTFSSRIQQRMPTRFCFGLLPSSVLSLNGDTHSILSDAEIVSFQSNEAIYTNEVVRNSILGKIAKFGTQYKLVMSVLGQSVLFPIAHNVVASGAPNATEYEDVIIKHRVEIKTRLLVPPPVELGRLAEHEITILLHRFLQEDAYSTEKETITSVTRPWLRHKFNIVKECLV